MNFKNFLLGKDPDFKGRMIDEIEEKNAWCLMELDDKDIKNLDYFDDSILKSEGTQLIWEKIKKFESSELIFSFHNSLAINKAHAILPKNIVSNLKV